MLRKLAVVLAAMAAAVAFAPAANATTDTVPTKGTAVLAPEIAISATEAAASCDDTYLCFWEDKDYGGKKGKVSGDNKHWSSFGQSACPDGNWNDCASSAMNRGTSCSVKLYQHHSYSGDTETIERGGNRRNLKDQDFNDRTSSNRWC